MKNIVLLLVAFTAVSASGAGFESQTASMEQALEPYGTVTGNDCHRLEITLSGPWGYRGIPKEMKDGEPDEASWAILRVNSVRLFLDLGDLDEGKVGNNPLYSIHSIRHHEKGTRFVPDSPSVFFSTTGSKSFMVQKVDLKKLASITDGTVATDSQMGMSLAERRATTILFVDQQHADYFQKALIAAILECKGQ